MSPCLSLAQETYQVTSNDIIDISSQVLRVPKGYITLEDGYFLTEFAGRYMLRGWTYDRNAKNIYRSSLDSLKSQWDEFKVEQDAYLTDLNAKHEQERKEWKKEILKSRVPGFGVYAGVVR